MTGGQLSPMPAPPPAPRSRSATLNEVALAAGVSLTTASRALNGSSRKVAESYRTRVEAAAARLGYTPNRSAQAVARGTSEMVVLLVGDISDPYFGELAAGVARGADESGLLVSIAATGQDPARELKLVRALRGQHPRGLILASSRTSPGFDPALENELRLVVGGGGRVVALGVGTESIRDVTIDNNAGARRLGVALTAIGYQRAVVLAAAEGVVTSDERVAGFVHGFEGGGGQIVQTLRGSFTRNSGMHLMWEALDEGVPSGTVVFATSDIMAFGALAAIRTAGRTVGSDIALAGFDDIAVGRDVEPRLTTVRVPLGELGYQALRAAVDAEWTLRPELLGVEVVIRDSTPARTRLPQPAPSHSC